MACENGMYASRGKGSVRVPWISDFCELLYEINVGDRLGGGVVGDGRGGMLWLPLV